MTNQRPPPVPPGNRLLQRLSEDERSRLQPLLKPVPLVVNDVLYEDRAEIDYAYFPIRGTLSALTIMQDGDAIEVATVGNEGVMGLTAALGPATSPHRV